MRMSLDVHLFLRDAGSIFPADADLDNVFGSTYICKVRIEELVMAYGYLRLAGLWEVVWW